MTLQWRDSSKENCRETREPDIDQRSYIDVHVSVSGRDSRREFDERAWFWAEWYHVGVGPARLPDDKVKLTRSQYATLAEGGCISVVERMSGARVSVSPRGKLVLCP